MPAFLVNLAGDAALSASPPPAHGDTRVRLRARVSAVFTLLWLAIAIVGALAGEMVFGLQRARARSFMDSLDWTA